MQVEHVFVISGADGHGQSHTRSYSRKETSSWTAVWGIDWLRLGNLGQESMKWLADSPHARHGRIDVDEDAQNTPAMRRTAGEGVHVQQVVAFMHRQGSSLPLQR